MAAKLYIRGRGTVTDRIPLTVRIRKEIVDRVTRDCVGPQYLAIEYLLGKALDDLEKMKGSIEIDAATLEPVKS
jgi:hypothetical protein